MRTGRSERQVAREFGVMLGTVQRWVDRAGDLPLEEVDWHDQSSRPHRMPRLTPPVIQERMLALRTQLRTESALGEYGAAAIREALRQEGVPEPPCERTINRILHRLGAFDGQRRVRRAPPPAGWYLPEVARRQAELDAFDAVVDLVIEGGQAVEVLTGIALHGGLIACWPTEVVNTAMVRVALVEHWQAWGLPAFAQFDNDTRFQGPHQHADVIGTVARLCLGLGVTPVYTPPREVGFQAAVESLNNRWQQKVWQRFHHESLAALQRQSECYVRAACARTSARQDAAPARRPFPATGTGDTLWDLDACPHGRIVYLRRTDGQGAVQLLGHTFEVGSHWCHRLVRAQLELDADRLLFYGLRRAEPAVQPLLAQVPYAAFRRHFRK